MFTGIVERMAEVTAAEHGSGGSRLEIALAAAADGVGIGDSIAVDGCCLTVVSLRGDRAAFDVAPESRSRTALGDLREGDLVNVERALRFGDRLDGHLVTGHVDGLARVSAIETRGIERDVRLELPAASLPFVVEKGSIALAGVSLTVAELFADGLRVMLIPHTCAVTTLGNAVVGTRLAFELDALGKFVGRWLEPYLAKLTR